MVTLVYEAWVLRSLTHSSWIGSGWPEWVTGHNESQVTMVLQPQIGRNLTVYPDRAVEFDQELNELQSYCYLSMILLNIIPGLFLDYCKKKFYNPENETYGIEMGLSILFTLSASLMIIHR